VEIILERGVTVRGVVHDPEGQPVAGATVAPANTGTGNSLTGDTRFSVQTEKDGTFTMLLPASNGQKYNLVAHDGTYGEWRNWANGFLPPFETTPGQRIESVDLHLARPAIIKGLVVNARGEPIAGCRVQSRPAEMNGNRCYDPETKTQADGTFILEHVSPGPQILQAGRYWIQPTAKTAGALVQVEANPDQPEEGVKLTAPSAEDD
jgi:Carboxypeptidase regulatory-like domain